MIEIVASFKKWGRTFYPLYTCKFCSRYVWRYLKAWPKYREVCGRLDCCRRVPGFTTATIWFVYILECSDGTLYTGVATDLDKRLKEHNTGVGAKYTRGRAPVKLLHWETFRNRSEATKREYQIKQLSRKKKLELIDG